MLAGGLLATGADELSLLHLLFYLRSAGGTGPLLGMAGGAQQDRIVGGPPALAERMAAALPPGALTLAAPVRAIEQTLDGATAWTDTGRVDGDAVVVALAPALAGRIRYDPPLPPLRDGLTQRMPMGSALKVHAVYPEPFWRADGLLRGVHQQRRSAHRDGRQLHADLAARGADRVQLLHRTPPRCAGCPPQQRRRCLLEAFADRGRATRRGPGGPRRVRLVGRRVDPGLLLRCAHPGHLADVRPAPADAGGAGALGGHRDGHPLGGYLEGAVRAGERAAAEVLAG